MNQIPAEPGRAALPPKLPPTMPPPWQEPPGHKAVTKLPVKRRTPHHRDRHDDDDDKALNAIFDDMHALPPDLPDAHRADTEATHLAQAGMQPSSAAGVVMTVTVTSDAPQIASDPATPMSTSSAGGDASGPGATSGMTIPTIAGSTADTSNPSALTGAASGPSTLLMALAGVALGGLAIAGMNNDSSSSTAEHAGPAHKLAVSVMAGPLKAPVKVEAFDKDGKLVASVVTDDSGHADLDFATAISGPLLIKASGIAGAGISHLDEATGTIRSLASPLRALIVVDGDAHVTVSPLSELAVIRMGLTADNAAVAPETASAVNATVAHLFGLSDVVGPAVTVLDTSYDTSDGVNDAERFGQQLAALSGADQVTGSEINTLLRLSGDIDLATGTMSTAGQDLIATGRNIFASSQNAAFATLIAATVPTAPTITNSAAAAAALAAGDMADGKVDATEAALGMSIPVALPANAIAGDTVTLTLAGSPGDSTQTAQTSTHVLTLGEISAGYALVALTAAQLVAGGDGLKLPSVTVTNALGTSAPMALGPVYVDAPPPQDVILPPPLPTTFVTPLVRLAPGQTSILNGRSSGLSLIVSYDGIQDHDSIQVTRNGVAIGSPTLVSNVDQQKGFTTVPVTLASLGADGLLAIGVVATNTIGTATVSNQLSVKLDGTAPALTLTGGAYVNHDSTQYTFHAAYPDMDVGDKIALTLANGTSAPTPLGSTYTVNQTDAGNHYIDFTATLAQMGADGSKTITAVATDSAGNVSAPVMLHVDVDRIVPAPAIAISAGQDHYINNSEAGVDLVITYSGMARDDVLEIRNIATDPTHPASSANALLATHTLSATEAQQHTFTLTVPKSSLGPDGAYQVAGIEKDLAGNIGITSVVTLDVANTLPDPTMALKLGESERVNNLAGGLDFEVRYPTMKVGDMIALKSGPTSLVDGTRQVIQHDIDVGYAGFALTTADLLGNTSPIIGRLIRATVTDVAGNFHDTPQMTIFVDTDVPVPQIALASGSSAILSSASPTTHVQVSYSGMATADVLKLYDGGTLLSADVHQLSSGEAGAGIYDFTVSRSDLATMGSHTLYATATDLAGNVGSTALGLSMTVI